MHILFYTFKRTLIVPRETPENLKSVTPFIMEKCLSLFACEPQKILVQLQRAATLMTSRQWRPFEVALKAAHDLPPLVVIFDYQWREIFNLGHCSIKGTTSRGQYIEYSFYLHLKQWFETKNSKVIFTL